MSPEIDSGWVIYPDGRLVCWDLNYIKVVHLKELLFCTDRRALHIVRKMVWLAHIENAA